jgi:hypothetical protein
MNSYISSAKLPNSIKLKAECYKNFLCALVNKLCCASGDWGKFVEQKFELSCNFICDQILQNRGFKFGHTLSCNAQ